MQTDSRWLVTLSCIIMAAQAEAQVAVREVWRDQGTGSLYALPANDDSSGRPPAIHVSDNGGQSWSRLPGVPDGAGGELATTTFGIIPNATGANVLFSGTNGNGLFRSIDGGTTWTAWNEAAVGIGHIAVAGPSGEASWVVTQDGALYVSLDAGSNWTLVAGIAGTAVTAVTAAGDAAWVGTDMGEIFALTSPGTQVTSLTAGAPLSGSITSLARTMDGTLYVGVDEGDPDGSHLYRTASADLTTFVEVRRDDAPLHLRGLAAVENGVYVLEYRETTIVTGSGEALDYLVTADHGSTFSEDFAPVVVTNQLFVGPCEGCEPWVFIAHAEGLYMKARAGLGWNVLGDVEAPPPPPPPPTLSNADLGVYMVSPNADRIPDTTRRFELAVTNLGPDDATGVVVEIKFLTWAATSSFVRPVNHWGESATIAGNGCERKGDAFSSEYLICRLDSLPSGKSVPLVLTNDLPDKTFELHIDAKLRANFNNDPFSFDNWMIYNPSVDPVAAAAPGGGGGGGGGGSFGLPGLLAMLGAAFVSTGHRRNCGQRRSESRHFR